MCISMVLPAHLDPGAAAVHEHVHHVASYGWEGSGKVLLCAAWGAGGQRVLVFLASGYVVAGYAIGTSCPKKYGLVSNPSTK